MASSKTNAMRILDRAGISYQTHEYENHGNAVDGVTVALSLGIPPERVYKTLVTQGASREHFVFVIPVSEELDLKKAARAVGEKHVEMLHVKDLLKTTGYVRGGCSPIGMKKQFVTVIDQSCQALPSMLVSAGKIGHQIELAPEDLIRSIGAHIDDLTQA